MAKATFLFALGFLALGSCKKQEVGRDSGLDAEMVRGLTGEIRSTMGIEPETFVPPTRTRGTTTVDVQDFGATGGNTTDDTQAFQDAIDALPADGGTVWVPAGTYYIKADFKDSSGNTVTGNCIRLRSNMHLKLSDFAHLKAIPNDAYSAYVVYANAVDNIEISGGEIVGERDQHLTTTGEAGMGIQIRGCNHVTIRDTKLSDFWGDGIHVGPTVAEDGPIVTSNDVVIDNIVSTNNRRQGLSIAASTNVQVWDSEFNETNGTSPQCGIDIEPIQGQYVDTVLIQNNLFSNNAQYGILLWKRVSNVTIKHCEMLGNQAGIVADEDGPVATYIAFNKMHNNAGNGLLVKDGVDDITVTQNTFYQNKGYPARPVELKIDSVTAETEKDMVIRSGATHVKVHINIYK